MTQNFTGARSSKALRGRGTHAGVWLSDYIVDQKNENMNSVIFLGGIKGWLAAGEGYTSDMD